MMNSTNSTTKRLAAAIAALALLTAACTGDDDTDEAAETEEKAADESDQADTEAAATEDQVDGGNEDEGDEDEAGTDISELDDDELLEYIDGLTQDEFDDFTSGLSEADYDRVVDLIEGDNDEEADESDEDSGGPAESSDAVDLTATRDDIDCSAESLGDDDTFAFTTAHVVVDGRLGAACFGEVDDRLTQAWEDLATITPPGQLADLGLFGGFEATEDSDEVTLAFVNTLDDDGTLFQMSINLDSSEEDPEEAQLTMAHEFAHVFTQLPSQMDRTVEGIDDCSTYFNGDGCLYDDSILWQWIELFWGPDLIAEVDPTVENSGADGVERCANDAGFFGSYAASTPDEDFAETFSAFVFDTGVDSDERRERVEWIADQPGLAEFNERAVAAGLTGLPNNFEDCGV